PGSQRFDRFLRQLLLGRHFQFTGLPHCLNQQAILRIARLDNGTVIAAFLQSLGGIETKPAALFLRAVTLETVFCQDWTNATLEKLGIRAARLWLIRGARHAA